MSKNLKIHNEEDKTIYELKLEEPTQDEKIKPSRVLLKITITIAVIALSIAIGYFLHFLMTRG
ncbi:MAG: hypothetical protein MJ188_08205 [Treponema sp.]|nr:hypothetical protein [Treponema sp.]